MFLKKDRSRRIKNIWREFTVNPEQIKLQSFFRKFIKENWRSGGIWFLEGFLVFLFLIACVTPVQEYLGGQASGDVDCVMLVLIGALGPAIAYMRIQPYTLYMENQKNRTIVDLLKYYPINRKEIKKMKTVYMIRFMAKLLPICILLQIPVTIWEYKTISWINVIFVVTAAFIWPIIWGMMAIWTEK